MAISWGNFKANFNHIQIMQIISRENIWFVFHFIKPNQREWIRKSTRKRTSVRLLVTAIRTRRRVAMVTPPSSIKIFFSNNLLFQNFFKKHIQFNKNTPKKRHAHEMREKQIKGKLATDWNCIRCSFSTLLISFCAEHLIGFCSRFFFLVSFSLWTTCCLRRNKRSKPERRSRRTLSFSITSLFSLFLFVFIEIVLLFTFSWLFLFNDFSIVLRLLRQTVSIADFWKKLHTAARLPDYITDFGNVPKWFMRIRGDISSVVGRTSHLHIVCCLFKKEKEKECVNLYRPSGTGEREIVRYRSVWRMVRIDWWHAN